MNIIKQTPEMILENWDFFADAIESTARKIGESYTPLQFYEVIDSGEATVFNVYEADELRGLLVLTEHNDRYTGNSVLHVDLLYLTGPSLIHEMTDTLNMIAQEASFDQIEFRSPRKGWFKYLDDAGFQSSTTFYKEL